MTDNRKTTVPGASVGADAVQSSHKTSTNIITNSDKQTKPMPCPAPVTSTEKGRAIEKNYFRNAGSRLPQP